MKPRHAASIALQAPVHPRHQDKPAPPKPKTCPHCLGRLTVHGFITQDNVIVETMHCKQHGDICDMSHKIAS